MKVLQLLPTLAMGDAIGNDVRALDKVIRGMGYQTGIYAKRYDCAQTNGCSFCNVPAESHVCPDECCSCIYAGSLWCNSHDSGISGKRSSFPAGKTILLHG